jgi:hypothetical protein
VRFGSFIFASTLIVGYLQGSGVESGEKSARLMGGENPALFHKLHKWGKHSQAEAQTSGRRNQPSPGGRINPKYCGKSYSPPAQVRQSLQSVVTCYVSCQAHDFQGMHSSTSLGKALAPLHPYVTRTMEEKSAHVEIQQIHSYTVMYFFDCHP